MRSLEDSQSRKITYLRLSITDRCNLRCTYCIPAEGFEWKERDEILRYEEILRVVAVGARLGLQKVRVTGGEPLVRRGVVEFIAELNRIEGLREMALSTNGVLFKRYAQALFDTGLRRVNFSLDSLNPRKFAEITLRDEFKKVWTGIEEAERVGFSPIKINVVLQKGVNDDEILDFARLTVARPFHVRFIELMPCVNYEAWRIKYYPMDEIKARIEKELGQLSPELVRDESCGPARNFRLPGGKGIIGFIPAISDPEFCNRCNRVRFTADGKLYPCLFGDTSVDFREALRRGCDDGEMERLFETAIGIKPVGHQLDKEAAQKMRFTMVDIGG